MAEAVEHASPAGDLANGASVVLLVEEEARLLAVLDVEVKDKSVLDDLDAGAFGNLRGLAVPPALVLRQALLRAGGRVVALVDAAHVLAVCLERLEQQGIDRGPEELHAHRAHLRDQHVLVAVDDEAGHAVCLREDHTAGVGVGFAAGKGATAHGDLAVLPRPGDPARPEGLVDAVVGVARNDAHADLGLLGKKPGPLPGAVLLKDVDHRAVGARLGLEDLPLEDPRVARLERASGLARDDDPGVRACLLHLSNLSVWDKRDGGFCPKIWSGSTIWDKIPRPFCPRR